MARLLALFALASAVLAQGERNVILLKKTQFLGDATAFPAFCAASAGKRRSDLRREVVAKLKEIAAAERKSVLAAVGEVADARPLWIVNAIAARLTEEQIAKARKHPSVRHVYPAGMLPRAPADPGGVAQVLKPEPHAAFTTKRKTIPWNLELLHVPDVWKLEVLGEGVVVAMLDAGVNYRHIMSMSFSIPDLGHARGLWRLVSEHATCAGLVLVSGAGNFPNVKVPEQIRIPEGIPCVICVGGVTKKRKFARFTSQGPVEWGSVKFYEDHPLPKGLVKPDVCAFPGPGIALVAPGDSGYLPKNNGRRGNSLSAPHVAGVCALVLSAKPDLPAWRVKEILEETATDLKPKGKDPRTGAGLVHALRAVRRARE